MAARNQNDRAFLRLLADRGPLTRAQLAQAFGLSRPYVLEVVDRLVAEGFVSQQGFDDALRRGPKAARYGIADDLGLAIGVELLDGRLWVRRRVLGCDEHRDTMTMVDADGDIADQVVDAVAISDADRRFRMRSISIGLPGSVNPRTGDITFAWGTHWEPGAAGRIRQRLGEQVTFDNEVNLRAVAERHVGVAGDVRSFVLLALGVGIGAAVMQDGMLLHGANGAAGEVGFMPVAGDRFVPMQEAGESAGGYQGLAGAVALARSMGRSHDDMFSWADELLDRGGDDPAWAEVASRIGSGISAIVTVVDPECVVLAGETARILGDRLLAPLQRQLARVLPWTLDLRVSPLGDMAVLTGATIDATSRLKELAFGATSALPATM